MISLRSEEALTARPPLPGENAMGDIGCNIRRGLRDQASAALQSVPALSANIVIMTQSGPSTIADDIHHLGHTRRFARLSNDASGAFVGAWPVPGARDQRPPNIRRDRS